MQSKILYTPCFKETLSSLNEFLSEKFGINSATKFLTKPEHTITMISAHPLMFKASAIDSNVRVALVTKQCSLFYKVTDSSIHLLFLWDNRQDAILSNV